MTSDQFRQRIRSHNTLQVLIGLTTLVAAPLVWLFSFWLFWQLFWLATQWFLDEKAAEVSFWIAVVGVVFLVIDGLREGWELFSLGDFAGRSNVGLFVPIGPSYHGNLHAYSYVLTHTLFFAPRVTLAAVRALRSRIRSGPFTIDLALKIYNDLAERDEWVGVAEFPTSGSAVALLRQFRLVWIDGDETPLRIRVPPGEAHQ